MHYVNIMSSSCLNFFMCQSFSGLVREFDAPSKLMGRPSLFGAMVQEHANRSSSMHPVDGM
jgi:hypothetical protein